MTIFDLVTSSTRSEACRGAITNITEMLFYSCTYSKLSFKTESLMKFKDAEESRSSLGSDMILISEVKMNSAENCNLYLPYISPVSSN